MAQINMSVLLADVVLAAAQWCEKTGTFISAERRIELVKQIIDPPSEAKPDYEIIWLVARTLGFAKEFPYTLHEEVFEEWKGLTRRRICDMSGVTYDRLRGKVGPQLPCPKADHPGTPRLFTDWRFPRPDGRAALLARDYTEPAETTDNEYPFTLLTGRLTWHFNSRTRTGRIPWLNEAVPNAFVEIHPEDAARPGIAEKVALELTVELDLEALLRSVASRAVELLKGTNGGLYLYRPERDVLEWAVAVDPKPAPIGTILQRGEGAAGKVWETGKPLIVDDYQHWEGRAAVCEGYDFVSLVDAPDLLGRRVPGRVERQWRAWAGILPGRCRVAGNVRCPGGCRHQQRPAHRVVRI